MSRPKSPSAQPTPHSWSVTAWPASVFPNDPARARYIVRANRDALIECGALSRIGRALVISGAAYSKWLNSQAERVVGYRIAPNKSSEHSATAA